jgi:hypothetical protein
MTVAGANSSEHWKMQILDTAAFIKTAFPAKFSQLAPQEVNLFLSFSARWLQWEALGADLKIGTPRYLKAS